MTGRERMLKTDDPGRQQRCHKPYMDRNSVKGV